MTKVVFYLGDQPGAKLEASYCWCGHERQSHFPTKCVGCAYDSYEDSGANPAHSYEEAR